MKKALLIASIALSTIAATSADATTVTVTIPDIGTYEYFGAGNASVTYDGVTFSQSAALSDGRFFNVSSGFSGSPPVVSSQQQTVGVANILVTLPVLVDSITIDFGTFNAKPVTFALSSGATTIITSTGSNYTTPDIFTSGLGTPFTSVQVTSNDIALNISSITYTIGPVPEPATWAMMLAGFGIMGYAMRRQARTTVAYA